MSYPIHITNIYELLNEDGEPTVRANTGSSQQAPAAKTTTQSRGGAQASTSSRGGAQGARDGQRRSNDSRPPRQDNRPPRSIDRRPNEIPVGGEFTDAVSVGVRRDRTENRPRDPHRSSERRARGADQVGENSGRRVYDRRSGTGRGREQKKGGAGRGNWGREGESEATPENWEQTEEGKEAPKEGETKVEEVVERDPAAEEAERIAREEQEKEDKMLTLDDYLKQKEAASLKMTLPEARKANEGVDSKDSGKWANYSVVKRDEDDEVVAKRDAKEKGTKNTVPLDQVFNVREAPRPRADREDRPFRGGRGGSRGGSRGGNRGGRGGSRGGRGGEAAPNFDLNSFPTLAPKA